MQDVKNTYFKEQKEFEEKQRLGFKTQDNFFNQQNKEGAPPYENEQPPKTVTNNFFGSRPFTQGRPFGGGAVKGNLIDDPDNFLHGDLEALTKEELQERLIVAEKVMRQLFQNNKNLEEKLLQHSQAGNTGTESQKGTANSSTEGCSSCKANKDQVLELENKVKELL